MKPGGGRRKEGAVGGKQGWWEGEGGQWEGGGREGGGWESGREEGEMGVVGGRRESTLHLLAGFFSMDSVPQEAQQYS